MNWLLLSLASAALSATTGLMQKSHVSRNYNASIATGCIFNFSTGIWCFVLGILTGGLWLEYTATALTLCIIISLAGVLSTAIYFYLLQYTDISFITIFGSLRSLFTLLGAFVLLHEVLSAVQLFGMALVLSGVIFTQQSHRKTMTLRTVLLLLAFACSVGLGNVGERYITMHMNIYLYLWIGFCLPSGILYLIQYMKYKKAIIQRKRTYGIALCVGFLQAIASVMMMYAIQIAPTATQPSIVSQSRVIITVILAALFLHERTHLRTKLFSAVLCVLGLILLK